MNWLRLVTDLLEVILWPALVLTVVLMFRKPLRELIPRVKSASGLGVLAHDVGDVGFES